MSHDKIAFVHRRLANAKKTCEEVATFHIANQLWNTSVNRLYYACYYAVSALLYYYDFESKTHSGTKRLFELHFIKTGIIDPQFGDFYAKLFAMRQNADYEDGIEYEKDDVIVLVEPANLLISVVQKVLTN